MRVFLDANVLFSASNVGSNVACLVEWLLASNEVVTSDLAREEALRNVARKRPEWMPALLDLLAAIQIVPSKHFPLSPTLPEKDIPILCSAIGSRCDYLVTGDKRDFGHLYNQTIEGVEVISLLRLAEILASR